MPLSRNGINLKILEKRFYVHCNMHMIVWDGSKLIWFSYCVALLRGGGGGRCRWTGQ
jgi:hypothetical protein